MKITQKGPADSELTHLVKNDKAVSPVRRETEDQVERTGESAKVNISDEARELQRIAELAKAGDELRAQKLNQIKEQIAKGEYHVDAEEVAKSIARSEVSRLLEKK